MSNYACLSKAEAIHVTQCDVQSVLWRPSLYTLLLFFYDYQNLPLKRMNDDDDHAPAASLAGFRGSSLFPSFTPQQDSQVDKSDYDSDEEGTDSGDNAAKAVVVHATSNTAPGAFPTFSFSFGAEDSNAKGEDIAASSLDAAATRRPRRDPYAGLKLHKLKNSKEKKKKKTKKHKKEDRDQLDNDSDSDRKARKRSRQSVGRHAIYKHVYSSSHS